MFRHHPEVFERPVDLVMIAKRGVDDFSFAHIEEEFTCRFLPLPRLEPSADAVETVPHDRAVSMIERPLVWFLRSLIALYKRLICRCCLQPVSTTYLLELCG